MILGSISGFIGTNPSIKQLDNGTNVLSLFCLSNDKVWAKDDQGNTIIDEPVTPFKVLFYSKRDLSKRIQRLVIGTKISLPLRTVKTSCWVDKTSGELKSILLVQLKDWLDLDISVNNSDNHTNIEEKQNVDTSEEMSVGEIIEEDLKQKKNKGSRKK